MNAAITRYEDQEFSYSVKARPKTGINRPQRTTNRPSYGRRRGKSPTSFNGMHRRRQRKLRW